MTAIYMRKGTKADIPAIMQIIEDARAFLKAQHINQWQGTYPDEPAVQQDIEKGTNRVLIVDGKVAGNASLIAGPDPFYGKIDGKGWLDDAPYMVIHRFALSQKVRGEHLSKLFMTTLLSEAYRRDYRDVRIDTHAQNVIMQHVVAASGFKMRGIVYLDEPVPERNAYEVKL